MMAFTFPVAGVVVPLWLPPLLAGGIAFFTSMVGISGAFLLVPLQMSLLGFSAPSASATALLYNLVAIPGAVLRYRREGRLWWHLAGVIALGGIPGAWLGAWLRIHYLAERRTFQLFVAVALLYLGLRLLLDVRDKPTAGGETASLPNFSVPLMVGASFLIGVVSTIYGTGGGAFMVPICVTLFRLPIHAVAGATLMATLLTSISALSAYLGLPTPAGVAAQPEWLLGILFGLGGFVGAALGARCQQHVPQRLLKAMLAVVLLGLAVRYFAE
ncbi:MAG: sulfite exporter TauE/SafE family protein [Magnetococcus sp. YQC-3]